MFLRKKDEVLAKEQAEEQEKERKRKERDALKKENERRAKEEAAAIALARPKRPRRGGSYDEDAVPEEEEEEKDEQKDEQEDEQEDEDEQPLSKRMRHLQEKISQEEVKVSCAMLLAPPALA